MEALVAHARRLTCRLRQGDEGLARRARRSLPLAGLRPAVRRPRRAKLDTGGFGALARARRPVTWRLSRMPHLFSEWKIRGVTLPNRDRRLADVRIFLRGRLRQRLALRASVRASGRRRRPRVHRGRGGDAEGRISPQDLGVWSEKHFEPLERIARFLDNRARSPASNSPTPAARAGLSPLVGPWRGSRGRGRMAAAAPSEVAFSATFRGRWRLTIEDIAAFRRRLRDRRRARLRRGFPRDRVARRSRLSHASVPVAAQQSSRDFVRRRLDNRVRFLLECAAAVRAALPDRCPLFVRLSATDWVEGGWDVEQSIELARRLKGTRRRRDRLLLRRRVGHAEIPVGPGYQVPFAARIRREAGIATAAVGMITRAEQAEQILANGAADMVLLAREMLRDPYWPLHAARRSASGVLARAISARGAAAAQPRARREGGEMKGEPRTVLCVRLGARSSPISPRRTLASPRRTGSPSSWRRISLSIRSMSGAFVDDDGWVSTVTFCRPRSSRSFPPWRGVRRASVARCCRWSARRTRC